MKKLFSLLFVALLAMSAWADTVVTVDFNAQGWETNTLVTDLKVDGVNLTFDRGEGSTKPTYFTLTLRAAPCVCMAATTARGKAMLPRLLST